MADDTFYPLTLNKHLGALTTVWVVPLSRIDLTSIRLFPISTMLEPSELDERPTRFQAKILDPYLYNSNYLYRDLTKANFNRNQLLLNSIGFSPLILG